MFLFKEQLTNTVINTMQGNGKVYPYVHDVGKELGMLIVIKRIDAK